MTPEKKALTATTFEDFSSAGKDIADNMFPVRNENNEKLDAADLFAHFTANVIKENAEFIR